MAERLVLRALYHLSFAFVPKKRRGFGRLARLIAKVYNVHERQIIRFRDDFAMAIDLQDPYWSRLICPDDIYEPELHAAFAKIGETPFRFIDCGANHGYWSLDLSSARYRHTPCIAVEALRSNLAILEQNNALNDNRVTVTHAAISDVADETVTFYHNAGHASASLIDERHSANSETVKTITLDAIANAHPSDLPAVIKLDVEGVEVQALKGAKELLKTHPLIFYEDHARDTNSTISRYILEELDGWEILEITAKGKLTRITKIEEINSRKVILYKGYNFFAVHPDSVFYAKLMDTSGNV